MATNDLRNIIKIETQGIQEFLAYTEKTKKELQEIKKILQDKAFKGNEAELTKAAAAYRREFLKAIKDVGEANNKTLLAALELQRKSAQQKNEPKNVKDIEIAIEIMQSLTRTAIEANNAVETLNESIAKQNEQQKKSNSTKKETVKLTDEELEQLETEKLRKREATQIAKQKAIITLQEKDTIASLRAQLSLVTLQWSKLTAEETKSTIEGVKLTAEKKRLTEQLKKLEMATGDARRNVGFYNSALGLLEKTALRVFVGRSIVEGIRSFGGFLGGLVEKGKNFNSSLNDISKSTEKAQSGLQFIGVKILEFLAPAIVYVSNLISKIPAFFGGVAAAGRQFADNVSLSFEVLRLRVVKVFEQINKANPFSKQSTDQINANIAAIDQQIQLAQAQQKGLLDAFNEGYDRTIKAQEAFESAKKAEETREERQKAAAEARKKADEARLKALEDEKTAIKEIQDAEQARAEASKQLENELQKLRIEAIEDVTKKALAIEENRFRLEQEQAQENFLKLRQQQLDALAKVKELVGETSEVYITAEVQTYNEISNLKDLHNSLYEQQEADHQAAIKKIKDDAQKAAIETTKKNFADEIAATDALFEEFVQNNEAKEEEQIAKDVEKAKKDVELQKEKQKALEDAIVSATQSTFDNVQKIMQIAADAENKAFDDALNNRQKRIDALNEDLQTATGAQRVYLEQQIAQEKAAQKKLAEQAKQARKEQAEAQRAVAIVQAIVNTAVAVTQALGSAPPPASFILAGAAGAAGAVEIATIAAQQFAKGGIVEGKSHAEGGVRASVKGAADVELEGGEAVMTVNATRMFKPQLSAMNVMGGGRAFKFGGEIQPNFQAIAQTSGGEQRRQLQQIENMEIVVNVTDITNLQNKQVQVRERSSL